LYTQNSFNTQNKESYEDERAEYMILTTLHLNGLTAKSIKNKWISSFSCSDSVTHNDNDEFNTKQPLHCFVWIYNLECASMRHDGINKLQT